MGLFDDLLPKGQGAKLAPGAAAKAALERELQRRRDAWVGREGYVYRGAGDLLLRHGQYVPGRALPDEYAHLQGPVQACFDNALNAVLADPTLRYMEGVYATGTSYFTTHAWAVDQDGRLVEVTYPSRELEGYHHGASRMPIMPPEHWAYWGVVLDIGYVREHHETLGAPLIDRGPETSDPMVAARGIDVRQQDEYPLLKVPYDPHRTSL